MSEGDSPSRDAAIQTARALVLEMQALRADLAVVSAQVAALTAAISQAGGVPAGPLVSEKFQSVLADLLGEAAGVRKPRRARR